MNVSVSPVAITRVNELSASRTEDILAAEEPLEIRLEYGPSGARTTKSISVTMRTPGQDIELATGFLFTEGIIHQQTDISGAEHLHGDANIVRISLGAEIKPDTSKLERNFYTTSSCGVCGKSSIEAVRVAAAVSPAGDDIRLSPELIYQLPAALRAQQAVFESTGGLHASALFDLAGNLLLTREDVGRHNALDKVIGAALGMGILPLQQHILLLSGRASFELMQKATMAGIKVVAAVGAPSGLAVQMAKESDITLLGFLRGERFNIYSGEQRIIV